MKKYKLKYWYLATGMDGIPDEYPEKIIVANSKDEALYEYHRSNGINFGTFNDFMKQKQYVREWATSCVEIV